MMQGVEVGAWKQWPCLILNMANDCNHLNMLVGAINGSIVREPERVLEL
jgi:hypothetical protein